MPGPQAWRKALGAAVIASAPQEQVAVLSFPPGTGSVAGLPGSDELSHFGAVIVDFQHHQLRLSLP